MLLDCYREYGQIYGNADVIQPGTIELWESLGLREGLMKEGTPILAYVRALESLYRALY